MEECLEKWLFDRLNLVVKLENMKDCWSLMEIITKILCHYRIVNETELKFLIICFNVQMKFNYLKHLLRKINVVVTMPIEEEIIKNNVRHMKSLLYEIYFKLSNKDSQLFQVENELVYKTDIRTGIENINKRLMMASGDCCYILNALRELEQSKVDNTEKKEKKRKKLTQLLRQEQDTNAIKSRILAARELTRQERLLKIAEMNVDKKPCECLDTDLPSEPLLSHIDKDITSAEINYGKIKSYNYQELLELAEAAKEMAPSKPNIEEAYKYVEEIKNKMGEVRKRINEKNERINAEIMKKKLTPKTSQTTVITVKSKKKTSAKRQNKKEKDSKKTENVNKKAEEKIVPIVEKTALKTPLKSGKKNKTKPQGLTKREQEEIKSQDLKKAQELNFLKKQIHLLKLHRKLYRKKLCHDILEDRRTYNSVINGCLDIAFHKKQYEEKYQMPLPDDILKEWKQLVIYGLTIKDVPFNLSTDFCDCHQVYHELKTTVRNNEIAAKREIRDYLNLEKKWQNDTKEPELQTISHVVLSLLALNYPKRPKEIKVTKELKCKTVLIIDVIEYRDKFIDSLKALIEIHNIVIITMADVIDFCIQFYINERINKLESDLYDFNDKYTVKIDLPEPKSPKGKKGKQRAISPAAKVVLTDNIEKETQTPSCIPDYYQFSSCAAIGKQARIYLAEEQSLDNEMLLNMLVEFINNNPDINGFVLLDYPQEESDIVQFEKIFTSMTPDIYNIGKPHDSRKSKLLTNNEEDEQFDTYLTNFIKMEQIKNNDFYEFSDVENCIDNFYKEQGVFSNIRYYELTLELTKFIARLIIGDFTMPRKTSEVLFGVTIKEETIQLDDETLINVYIKRKNKEGTVATVKKKASKKKIVIEVVIPDNEIGIQTSAMDIYRCCKQCEEANRIREKWYNNESDIEMIPYVSAQNVDQCILEQMADNWINLEAAYLYNIKTALLGRLNFIDRLTLFKNYVKKCMKEFLERPTFNKNFINNIRDSYYMLENKLKENFRKEFLHCIVVEIHTNLYELCNMRYVEALDLRKNFMQHNFFSNLLTTLTNETLYVYSFELNRCFKTLSLLQTYYYCIMQRKPNYNIMEAMDPNFITPPIFNNEIPIYLQDIPSMPDIPYREMPCDCFEDESKYNYELKFGNEYLKKFTKLKKEDIKALQDLANCVTNKTNEIKLPSMFVEKLKAQLDYSYKILDITKHNLFEEILAEKISYIPQNPKLPDLSEILIYENDPLVKITLKLVQDEAIIAYNEEIERVKFRIKDICDKTINDINEYIKQQRSIYEVCKENIIDRMKHEKLCCDYLAQVCHQAIESTGFEKHRKWLDDNRFIIQTGVIIFPDYPTPEFSFENVCPSHFMLNVNQLMKFVNEMSKIAPNGYCSFDTLAYYLKDIAGCAQMDNNERVPETWNNLTQYDIEIFLRKLYDCIPALDWRDFVINNLDIRLPTINEILEMRKEFKSYALRKTCEVISRKNYNKCHLWYESDIEYNKLTFDDALKWKYFWLRNLLFKMYQNTSTSLRYTELLFGLCKDENPRVGFVKALSLCKGELINDNKELEQQYLSLLTMKRDRHELLRQEVCEQIIHEMIDKVVQECDGIEIRDATSKDIRDVEKKLKRLADGDDNTDKSDSIESNASNIIALDTNASVLEDNDIIEEEFIVESKSHISSYHEYEKLEDSPFSNRKFWIEPNIVILLLERAFPWYRIEFDNNQTMKQRVYNICKSIITDSIEQNEAKAEVDNNNNNNNNNKECLVLVHKLMDRGFIRNWIEKGLKFKKVCPGLIVLDILQKEHGINFFK